MVACRAIEMNSRERFLRAARGQPVDRVPYLEEVLRKGALERWYAEGLSRRVTEQNYQEFFGLDRHDYIYLSLEPKRGPLRSKEDFKRLEEAYRSDLPEFRRPRFWEKKASEYRSRDFPLGIMGWRGFMLPLFTHEREWDSLRDVLLALYDYPELVARTLDLVADCYIDTLGLALEYLDFDFGIIHEPIASPSGPVISPRMFRDLVLPCYRRIIGFFHTRGIDIVIFRSFSNVGMIIPLVVEAGVTGVWISQIGGIIDYAAIRRDHPDILLVGGIDSRVLAQDEDAIVGEVTARVPPLLTKERYFPSLDDNPRENVPYQNYVLYRRVLKEVCEGV